jgi:hypothetical protein
VGSCLDVIGMDTCCSWVVTVKTAVLAVQGVAGHGTPAVQYAPDHDHAVQGTSNPTCNSLPCTTSNQQSSDYAITPN